MGKTAAACLPFFYFPGQRPYRKDKRCRLRKWLLRWQSRLGTIVARIFNRLSAINEVFPSCYKSPLLRFFEARLRLLPIGKRYSYIITDGMGFLGKSFTTG